MGTERIFLLSRLADHADHKEGQRKDNFHGNFTPAA